MSLSFRTSFDSPYACAALALLACGLSASAAQAQNTSIRETPKLELFGGYTYFYPHATISGLQPGATLPLTNCLCAEVRGGGGSATYNLTRWLGITADGSASSSGSGSTLADNVGKANFYAFSAGPKITYRARHFVPFAEILVGMQRLSPKLFASSSAFGMLAGGGVDLPVSRHFAVRLVRADYAFSNQQFGSSVPATNVRGLRLESGVVFLFGGHAHHADAPAVAALIQPAPPAMVAAAISAPVLQPLSLSLAASPSVLVAGQSSTITANAVSPGVGALTYSFRSSAGAIAGTGATALLTTAGVAAGPLEVTGMVADEHGQTATATTSVTLTAAAVAAAATSSDLGSISFARDRRRPVRVDNEAKAMLDGIALNLQRNFDARLALIGNAAASEGGRAHLAAQRAAHTKQYLVQDKGIDASRISLFSGSADAKTTQIMMIPLGARLDTEGDIPLEEASLPSRAGH